ncbi:unnamed protein product, partial [Effrenium voratum]
VCETFSQVAPMSQAPRKAGLLEGDKEFHQFVGRMIPGSALSEFSDEQLWQVINTPTAKRRLAVLQRCRNSQGRLDANCFCREACNAEYLTLASCVRGGGDCRDQVNALTACTRDEWRAFLFGSSPSLQNDAIQRNQKFVDLDRG